MTEIKTTHNAAVDAILAEIEAFRRSKSNLPTTADHATDKLLAKSFDPDEIAHRREAFTTHDGIDRTAVLANYELLHGVKYLDKLRHADAHAMEARSIVSIMRGAEICLENMAVLAGRMHHDVQRGDFEGATVKMTWMNHFNDSLYRLSQFLVQIDTGRLAGDFLSINDSAAFQSYTKQCEAMQATLSQASPESLDDIFDHDIDHPRRFTFFHAFVNTNYEAIWLAVLRQVRVPGVCRAVGETPSQFYRRVVQSEAIQDAVTCVDLKEVTYLMQFRAYHQISEVLVKLVNDLIAGTIETLVDEQQRVLEHAAASLTLCNKLLQIVTDNIKPIVRTLSPKAYFAIRPALGITSGSHSHNLRKGLFLTIYPLLVRSLRLRLADFDASKANDDVIVLARATKVLRGNADPQLSAVIRQVVCVHQYVRTWRDEHIQFVKTQIGVSPEDVMPTASISGAENAAQTAHSFRKTHKADPIAPLYEAVLGRRPTPPLPIVHSGRFDAYMAAFTAEAVHAKYADVQQRARRKRDTLSR